MRSSALCAALAGMALPAIADGACTVTVTPVVFGKYDVFDEAPTDVAAQVLYECIGPVERLRIRIAPEPGGNGRTHWLVNGDARLGYQLFLDPAMTRAWGDETGGTEAIYVEAPAIGKSVSLAIFARIPPRQNVSAGTYTQSLTLLVDY